MHGGAAWLDKYLQSMCLVCHFCSNILMKLPNCKKNKRYKNDFHLKIRELTFNQSTCNHDTPKPYSCTGCKCFFWAKMDGFMSIVNFVTCSSCTVQQHRRTACLSLGDIIHHSNLSSFEAVVLVNWPRFAFSLLAVIYHHSC